MVAVTPQPRPRRRPRSEMSPSSPSSPSHVTVDGTHADSTTAEDPFKDGRPSKKPHLTEFGISSETTTQAVSGDTSIPTATMAPKRRTPTSKSTVEAKNDSDQQQQAYHRHSRSLSAHALASLLEDDDSLPDESFTTNTTTTTVPTAKVRRNSEIQNAQQSLVAAGVLRRALLTLQQDGLTDVEVDGTLAAKNLGLDMAGHEENTSSSKGTGQGEKKVERWISEPDYVPKSRRRSVTASDATTADEIVAIDNSSGDCAKMSSSEPVSVVIKEDATSSRPVRYREVISAIVFLLVAYLAQISTTSSPSPNQDTITPSHANLEALLLQQHARQAARRSNATKHHHNLMTRSSWQTMLSITLPAPSQSKLDDLRHPPIKTDAIFQPKPANFGVRLSTHIPLMATFYPDDTASYSNQEENVYTTCIRSPGAAALKIYLHNIDPSHKICFYRANDANEAEDEPASCITGIDQVWTPTLPGDEMCVRLYTHSQSVQQCVKDADECDTNEALGSIAAYGYFSSFQADATTILIK